MASDQGRPRYICADDPCVKAAMAESPCKHPTCASVRLARAALVVAMSDPKIQGNIAQAMAFMAGALNELAAVIIDSGADVVLYGVDDVAPSHAGSAAVH